MKPLLACALILCATTVSASDELGMRALLDSVKAGSLSDRQTHEQRLRTFTAARDKQQLAVLALTEQKRQLEARITELEAEFSEQQEELRVLGAQRDERMGDLKELYGVIQQQLNSARGQFDISLTRPQYPQRERDLAAIAEALTSGDRLADISDIEQLWFELLREMQASAEIVSFDADVVSPAGVTKAQSVTRVGLFNVVSQGRYLQLSSESGGLSVLARQPGQDALATAAALSTASATRWFSLDPTRGQLLSLLVEAPDLRERLSQGGVVGYVIVALGVLALLVGLSKLMHLYWVGHMVNGQKRDLQEPRADNPLGRVLGVYKENTHLGCESLELKLSEAVLCELPPINRWVSMIKIIAAVAPLLGLLGTVLGMILTFQSITLLGTGDPKLMAGGISTALVTTVLGLLVAVPALLVHSMAASKVRSLTLLLEQQALGLVALHSEQAAPPPAKLQVA